MASPQRLHGHRVCGHHHVLPPQNRAHSHRKAACLTCGPVVLGAEFRLLGQWIRELCEDRDQVWKKKGAGAEWMEDPNCEFAFRLVLGVRELGNIKSST